MKNREQLKEMILDEVKSISITKGYETKIEIGGVVFLVITDDYELFQLIKKRFYAFLSINPPDLFIEVQVKEQIPTRDFAEIEVVKVEARKSLFIRSPYAGLVDLEQRKVKLAIRMRKEVNSVETLLRICSSYFLPDFNGLLLHAASIGNKDKGFVFCGKSECGKTTIAQLSTKYTVFTDEISIIRQVDGVYKVFSTPFWGLMEGGKRDINSSSQIETIFFPRKSKKVYLKKIHPFNSLPEIMKNILFFMNDEIRSQKIFELCYGIAKHIPCYELYFLPNNSFWRCILDEREVSETKK